MLTAIVRGGVPWVVRLNPFSFPSLFSVVEQVVSLGGHRGSFEAFSPIFPSFSRTVLSFLGVDNPTYAFCGPLPWRHSCTGFPFSFHTFQPCPSFGFSDVVACVVAVCTFTYGCSPPLVILDFLSQMITPRKSPPWPNINPTHQKPSHDAPHPPPPYTRRQVSVLKCIRAPALCVVITLRNVSLPPWFFQTIFLRSKFSVCFDLLCIVLLGFFCIFKLLSDASAFGHLRFLYSNGPRKGSLSGPFSVDVYFWSSFLPPLVAISMLPTRRWGHPNRTTSSLVQTLLPVFLFSVPSSAGANFFPDVLGILQRPIVSCPRF